MQLLNESQRNVGRVPTYTDAEIEIARTGADPNYLANTNWVDRNLQEARHPAESQREPQRWSQEPDLLPLLRSPAGRRAIPHDGGAYGVALLSRYPLQDTLTYRLPTQAGTNGEPRVLAVATITLPTGQQVRLGNTHLDAQRASTNRQLQAAEIVRLAAAETLPFVVGGDFNAETSSPVVQQIDTHFKRTCQPCPPPSQS